MEGKLNQEDIDQAIREIAGMETISAIAKRAEVRRSSLVEALGAHFIRLIRSGQYTGIPGTITRKKTTTLSDPPKEKLPGSPQEGSAPASPPVDEKEAAWRAAGYACIPGQPKTWPPFGSSLWRTGAGTPPTHNNP